MQEPLKHVVLLEPGFEALQEKLAQPANPTERLVRAFREIVAPLHDATPPDETEAESDAFMQALIHQTRQEMKTRTPTPADTGQILRVNVNFSESAYQTLEELAAKRGKSMADVLRDAIALAKWAEDIRDEGATLLVDRGGQIREVLLR